LTSFKDGTVRSGELDASKGGTSAMEFGFVTKRGTTSITDNYQGLPQRLVESQ
jgi:hypothetical protein